MLETTMSSQVLATNKMLGDRMLAANEVGDIEGGGQSKHVKPKIRRSENWKLSKGQNLSKFKKLLTLEHAFILLKLAFTNIQIEENDFEMLDTKSIMQSFWPCLGFKIWRPQYWQLQVWISLILRIRSSKPNHSAILPSSARPLKSSLLLDAFPFDTF